MEEHLIERVIKNGLEYDEKIHKYYVLWIAIARVLILDKMPLDANDFWEIKKLGGERKMAENIIYLRLQERIKNKQKILI